MKQQTFPLVKRWLNSLPPWNANLFLINTIESDNILLNNIIGFASDTCNIMFENITVLYPAWKRRSQVSLSCIVFAILLIFVHHMPVRNFPPWTVEELMHDVYNYFCHSQDEFRAVQYFSDVEPHKLLRPCQTRWLSLYSCVRIKAHWAMGWTHKVLSSCS